MTLGFHERNDFGGAVRFLRERRPDAKVLLYGVSMGAVAALLAASELTEVDAVVADSPFLNIEHTVMHHLDLISSVCRAFRSEALSCSLWSFQPGSTATISTSRKPSPGWASVLS